jgi:hypothetical protein
MRTLVEQTEANVLARLLRLAFAATSDDTPERTKVNEGHAAEFDRRFRVERDAATLRPLV